MSNKNIIFDEDEFIVDKVKDFGDPVGEFRVIRYDTGYYALQRHNVDMISDNPGGLIWETLCIAPQLDTPLDNGYDWKFSQGRLTMNSFLGFLDDARKLRDNELMELHLHLNTNLDEEVSEEIIHLISSEDGREIKDKIFESIKLQDDTVDEYYAKLTNQNKYINILLIFAILLIFVIIISIVVQFI